MGIRSSSCELRGLIIFSLFRFSNIRPVTSILFELRVITIPAAKIQVYQQQISTQGPHGCNHENLSQLGQRIDLSLLPDVSDACTARSHALIASNR